MIAGLDIIATAEIMPTKRPRRQPRTVRPRSAIDNRVAMKKIPTRDRRAPKAYRVDKQRIGRGTVIACTSWVPSELVLLDAFAQRAGVSRSRLLRDAFMHYAGCVGSGPPEGEP